MMKKVLISAGMVICAVFVLVACSSNEPESPNVTPEGVPMASGDYNEPESPNVTPERVPMASGDYIVYNCVSELSAASSYVIRAEVLDERVEEMDVAIPEAGIPFAPMYDIVTIYRLLVLEVFQGNVTPGEIMEVRRLGGELNGPVVRSHHQTLTIGDDLVLFMYRFEEVALPPVLVNASQGAYRFPSVPEGGLRAENLANTLESLNHNRHRQLAIAIDDLVSLQYQNYGAISESLAGMFEDGALEHWGR